MFAAYLMVTDNRLTPQPKQF